jgi:hypothetical protein
MIDLIQAHKPNHYFQTTQQTRGFRARSEITWFPVIINNWSSQQLSYHPQVWFHQHWLIIHPTIGNHFNNVKDNTDLSHCQSVVKCKKILQHGPEKLFTVAALKSFIWLVLKPWQNKKNEMLFVMLTKLKTCNWSHMVAFKFNKNYFLLSI